MKFENQSYKEAGALKTSLEAAPFKKDLTTYLAVILFFLVFTGEMLLIVWLPMQLRSDSLWAQEVALQEMIVTLDDLRDDMDRLKDVSRRQEGQAVMLRNGINVIAQYVRVYGKYLSTYQIGQISEVLMESRNSFKYLADGKEFGEEMEINPAASMRRIFSGLVVNTPEKSEAGRK